AVERSLAVAQDAPRLVASERETVIKAVHEEMGHTLGFIREERVAALEQVARERTLVMNEMNETIDAHPRQITAEVEQIDLRKIDYAMQRVTWLVAAVVGVVALMALVGLVVVRRTLDRHLRKDHFAATNSSS